MQNRIAGSILVSASGLAATIGAVGYHIVRGLVAKSRYDSQIYLDGWQGQEVATLRFIVVLAVLALAIPGVTLMIRAPKED